MLLELLSRPFMRTSKRVIEIDHLSPTALSPLRTASLYPASKPQRETIEDRLDRIGPEAEATEADQPVDKGEDFFCKRSGSSTSSSGLPEKTSKPSWFVARPKRR